MVKSALITDYYELTMANSYYLLGMKDKIVAFDYFFRTNPIGGYSVFCGLDDLLDEIENFKFTESDIKFLESKKDFSKDFLNYLKDFKFSGEIYAFPEGSVVFPNEPIITVKGNVIECQILETILLLIINHQSLIATKANKIVNITKKRPVLEFGARRAHGKSAAVMGAKAAYIGGVSATSVVLADKLFKIPAVGTMAHSYVSLFDSEYDAFLAYAKTYPDNVILLVDTYDTLKSGIPNAIKLYHEYLKKKNKKVKGIRIDSGDISYLSKEARKMLDKNGMRDTKIIVSNSLDEDIIKSLDSQGAKVDTFAIGERLITSKSNPVFPGVYKLAATFDGKKMIPKIKVSNTLIKTTTPGFKKVYRFYDKNNMAIADVITLFDETITGSEEYLLFDPIEPYKEKLVKDFKAVCLTKKVFSNGKRLTKKQDIKKIRKYLENDLKTFWEEVKRSLNPHKYYVDLSKKLYDLKEKLIKESKIRND